MVRRGARDKIAEHAAADPVMRRDPATDPVVEQIRQENMTYFDSHVYRISQDEWDTQVFQHAREPAAGINIAVEVGPNKDRKIIDINRILKGFHDGKLFRCPLPFCRHRFAKRSTIQRHFEEQHERKHSERIPAGIKYWSHVTMRTYQDYGYDGCGQHRPKQQITRAANAAANQNQQQGQQQSTVSPQFQQNQQGRYSQQIQQTPQPQQTQKPQQSHSLNNNGNNVYRYNYGLYHYQIHNYPVSAPRAQSNGQQAYGPSDYRFSPDPAALPPFGAGFQEPAHPPTRRGHRPYSQTAFRSAPTANGTSTDDQASNSYSTAPFPVPDHMQQVPVPSTKSYSEPDDLKTQFANDSADQNPHKRLLKARGFPSPVADSPIQAQIEQPPLAQFDQSFHAQQSQPSQGRNEERSWLNNDLQLLETAVQRYHEGNRWNFQSQRPNVPESGFEQRASGRLPTRRDGRPRSRSRSPLSSAGLVTHDTVPTTSGALADSPTGQSHGMDVALAPEQLSTVDPQGHTPSASETQAEYDYYEENHHEAQHAELMAIQTGETPPASPQHGHQQLADVQDQQSEVGMSAVSTAVEVDSLSDFYPGGKYYDPRNDYSSDQYDTRLDILSVHYDPRLDSTDSRFDQSLYNAAMAAFPRVLSSPLNENSFDTTMEYFGQMLGEAQNGVMAFLSPADQEFLDSLQSDDPLVLALDRPTTPDTASQEVIGAQVSGEPYNASTCFCGACSLGLLSEVPLHDP